MLTTNYNVVQVSADDKGKYHVGDIFKVPEYKRNDWRCMKFDGLVIRDICFGWGIFLHFTWHEWEGNRPNLGQLKNELYFQSKGLNFI